MTEHGHPQGPWTTGELASALRVTKRKILAMIHDGDLKATRLGPHTFRIPHAEAMRLIHGTNPDDADEDAARAPLAVA